MFYYINRVPSVVFTTLKISNFSRNFTKLLDKSNIKRNEIAKILDVSRQSIYKYETDSSIPSIEKLVVISKLFGVSINSLFA